MSPARPWQRASRPRFGRPRERIGRAGDRDAAWARATDVPAHDQPGSAPIKRLKEVFPRDGVAAVPVRNRQCKIPWRIDRRDDECVSGAGDARHDVTGSNALQRSHDASGTWRATVIDGIPAVPAGTTSAHLRDPWPHLFRRRVNRDGVSRRKDWIGNHCVDGKRPTFFDGGRKAGGERHDALRRQHLLYLRRG